MLLAKRNVIGLVQNVWKLSLHRLVPKLLECRSQKTKEPHHPEEVPWSGIVLFPLNWGIPLLVVVPIVNVYAFLHFHFDKTEEPMVFRELFVIGPDDCGFLRYIRKGHSENRTHVCKKQAKLIEYHAELINWYLLLFLKDNIYLFEGFYDQWEVEWLWHFFNLYNL